MLEFLLLFKNASASVRNPDYPLGGPKNIIVVNSATEFCMFLPPRPNVTIAESEGYPFATGIDAEKIAVSYCTKNIAEATGHQLFYDGFVTGAHFAKNDVGVQITGTINASIAGIPLDGGGYYDLDHNVNSPPGGICLGYDSFYNNVNPIDGIFCIKCCKGLEACEIFNGHLGCSVMVPGDYSVGFDGVPPPKTGRVPNVFNNGSVVQDKTENAGITLNLNAIKFLWLLIAL